MKSKKNKKEKNEGKSTKKKFDEVLKTLLNTSHEPKSKKK